jgi:hypothetical protein
MDLRFDNAYVQVVHRQAIELTDAVGTVLTCISGSLWITQHLDKRDVVLSPGEAFTLDRKGVAIVQATADAVLRIDQPRWRRSLWLERWIPRRSIPATTAVRQRMQPA